ncbi:MAG TPA: hypothetical protein VMZ52_20480 [Bryobacteraceae bacterium]|nr:hypothetical protein [Bryobacteraceae bacterium]
MNKSVGIVMAAVAGLALLHAETMVNGRRAIILEGKAAKLILDLGGGSLVDFHLLDHGLNPLVWGEKSSDPKPREMGHFICLDRWGPPSAAEQKNGMMFHGEATHVDWKETGALVHARGRMEAAAGATLPMAGLAIQRRIRLLENQPVFRVSESVTNINKLGRVYNLVEHATIGPPFLETSTLVDSNGRKGFMQSSPMPNPEEPAVIWPHALKDGQSINMRRLAADPAPNVVSYTMDEEYGWVTAGNPARGLLLGYIWKTAEFPWLNLWRHVENGKPLARGLEFGTTGLHQPYPVLVRKGSIFGRPLYSYIDANEMVTRSYIAFLAKIPSEFQGVERVMLKEGRLSIIPRGGPELHMEIGDLLRE